MGGFRSRTDRRRAAPCRDRILLAQRPANLDNQSPLPPDDQGSARPVLRGFANYEILSELGRGAMGVVYQARDRKRNHLVALKTLHRIEPAWLHRFKAEFRVMQYVAHPNLVPNYELVSDGEVCFLTMELVEGCDFLRYVAEGPEAVGRPPGSRDAHNNQEVRPLQPQQLERLRHVLSQLVIGVDALHRCGILHRDIKPSNVLVTREGRLVILDFGLAVPLREGQSHEDREQQLVGTIYYMSPEQSMSRPVSQASDWYSVGAMLFEALTGRPPFIGKLVKVVLSKESREPPAPAELVTGVPDDLNELCARLLRRQPRDRPRGDELLRRLAGVTAPSLDYQGLGLPDDAALFGRQRHLQVLRDAFVQLRQRRGALTLLVHGKSGQGKSALMQRFLGEVAQLADVVVLVGRCYERESVPFKALDSLIDDLTEYLMCLPERDVEHLISADVAALARVFPVLRQVRAVGALPLDDTQQGDQQQLRRRAFHALRDLLTRIGRETSLVLCIDDLQWGDVDSAVLLIDLLMPPDPPPLLLLGSYRSDECDSSPFLRRYRELRGKSRAADDEQELEVGPLSTDDSLGLARLLLGMAGDHHAVQAENIAQESGGNPFFVAELVRHVQTGSDLTAPRAGASRLNLDEVLWARVTRLPLDEARRILEVVAIAGQPLPINTVYDAADVRSQGPALLVRLQSDHLVRTVGAGEQMEVETYHDRVREAVVHHLESDRQRVIHGSLASALERSGRADAEFLAVHHHGAGQLERAGYWYALAAERATEALAFDRAAKLYRQAIELRSDSDSGRALRERLGHALANAGRGAEAAQAYLAATCDADAATTLDLKRRAATQYLLSGHLDAGMEALREVLQAVGLTLPRTPLRALLSLLSRRMQLAVRGLSFRERSEELIEPAELTRVDTCWSVGTALGVVDPIRGAEFQTRSLLYALRAGEPYRIARALAWEAGHVSTGGGAARRQTTRLLEEADELAQRVRHPHALGMVSLAKGISAYLQGRWRTTLEFCDRAKTIFQDQCTGVAWERDTAETFALWSLTYMGELAELGYRRPRCLQEARARGDLYAQTNFSTYIMSLDRMAADQTTDGREELRQAVAQWTQQGFHVQHHNALLANTLLDLYDGQALAAWQRITNQWPAYRKSLLLRVQQVRIDVLQSRARCALAVAARQTNGQTDRRRLLRSARRDSRRLDAERIPWASALAQLIRAALAAARQDDDQAVLEYRRAAKLLEDVDMRLFAAAARRRCGELLGGSDGPDLIETADQWMRRQQVRRPDQMAAMVVPDFRAP